MTQKTPRKKKRISIGISDYQKLREGGYYYVDKSLLAQEILESGAEVLLLPRPRRFGKTLNLSMLRYFFEKNETSQRHLFEGLAIAENPECMEHQGRYPVINITLKDIQTPDYPSFLQQLGLVLSFEYRRHDYLLTSERLSPKEKEEFHQILDRTNDPFLLINALWVLSRYLSIHHDQPAIILIDEYDSPIHAGFEHGYYDEVVDFFRRFLGSVLKDNPHLERAVMTGILRISKESIFSELNHIQVCSLLKRAFSTHFGLLESEVKAMLEYYGMVERFEIVSRWYNGYRFGGNTIYNPWSVINYIKDDDPNPSPYWVNTSSNNLIHKLLNRHIATLREDLEALLRGDKLVYTLEENTIFPDIELSNKHIWSFLVFTGYLKAINARLNEMDELLYDLEIPNTELRRVFRTSIQKWVSEGIGSQKLEKLLSHLIAGQIDEFMIYLREMVEVAFSTHNTRHDFAENAYHMFVLGLMVNLEGRYHVRSNRESGLGRYDLALEPKNPTENGFLFEFKRLEANASSEPDAVQASLEEALQQIEEKKYHTELQARGIQKIYCISLVFTGKVIHHLWRLMDFAAGGCQ